MSFFSRLSFFLFFVSWIRDWMLVFLLQKGGKWGVCVRDREKQENTTLPALSLQEQTPQIWLSFTANRQATHLSCRCFFSSSWLATRSCQAVDFLAFSLASCLGIGCAVGSA